MTTDPAEARRMVRANTEARVAFWFYQKHGNRQESNVAYEQKDNSGTLFRNDRRDKDTQPHAKGKALIGGVWYWVSAWTKEPRQGGDKFQSLSFEPMTEEQVTKYAGGGQQQQSQSRGGGGGWPGRAPEAPRQERQRPQAPFGQEKVFASSDIPF